MEMKFDPMTGEPIKSQENETKEDEVKFDPMTGEPVKAQETEAKEDEVKFDPMTGEPVKAQESETKEDEVRFDPMTGEPVKSQNSESQDNDFRFDPMTGKPIGESGSSDKKTISGKLIGCIAAIAIVIVVIGIALSNGVGKTGKVLTALANTVQPTELMKDANFIEILDSDKYTIAFSGDVEDIGINAKVAVNRGNELFVKGDFSYDGFSVDASALMNKKQVLLSIPDLLDQTLMYGINDDNSGYLVDLLEDEGYDIESINEYLKTALVGESNKDYQKYIASAAVDTYKLIKFENVKSKEYKVDGKKRKCKGYSLEVDEDLLEDIIDIWEDKTLEYVEDYEDILDLGDVNLKYLFKELKSEVKNVDATVTVYIYKKQVACIDIESNHDDITIEFQGGRVPWQNTVVEYDGREVLSISGKNDGSKEKYELTIDGDSIEYTYDTKSGKFDICLDEGYYRSEIEGVLNKKGSSIELVLDDVEIENDDLGEYTIIISKGADVDKINTSDVFDIGNASRSEITDLLESVSDSNLARALYYF